VSNIDKAEKIVAALIKDLSDRRGLRHEWEQIDDDIQEEIRNTWVAIVLSKLAARPLQRRQSREPGIEAVSVPILRKRSEHRCAR